LDSRKRLKLKLWTPKNVFSIRFPNNDYEMMTNELILLSAFVAGLVGSVHCIGMCGGIVGLLTMSLPDKVRQSYLRLTPYLLIYNVGRISSYIVAGGLAGFLGEQFSQWLPLENPRIVAMWVSGLFMIALGLYIGAWWQALTLFEKAGNHIWRKIEPLGRRFLPVKHPLQALGLGLVWGWLPCGLVYSILFLALASNSTWHGGFLMLAFGLGTLPMLLTMGATAQWLTRFAHKLIVRRIAGAVVILFGLMILFAHSHH
jgi:sulfite exporter TauE/SafE